MNQECVEPSLYSAGWLENFQALSNASRSQGHELASHGYWHRLAYDQTPQQFAKDIADSKIAIADASGIEVTAYRAPSFSITERSRWALDVLVEHGFRIDSSIFPIAGHHRYGWPDATREIHKIETDAGTICEFPPSSWTRGRASLPIGGGYFRLFPLKLTCQSDRSGSSRRTARDVLYPSMGI